MGIALHLPQGTQEITLETEYKTHSPQVLSQVKSTATVEPHAGRI